MDDGEKGSANFGQIEHFQGESENLMWEIAEDRMLNDMVCINQFLTLVQGNFPISGCGTPLFKVSGVPG